MTVMPDPSIAIQTSQLSKHLDGRRVLRGIDLEIRTGECIVLTGENGAGKTTLLRCLAAMTRPTSGEVRWFGRPAAEDPQQRRLLGLVSHESGLYAHLTLRENLLFAARMTAASQPTVRVDELLDQIGLQDSADRQVRQISKGMRQRLALARGLIHEPRILLLDEPFSGLDGTSSDWLAAMLCERRSSGCTICLATHGEEPCADLADRNLHLRQGAFTDHQASIEMYEQPATWRYAS